MITSHRQETLWRRVRLQNSKRFKLRLWRAFDGRIFKWLLSIHRVRLYTRTSLLAQVPSVSKSSNSLVSLTIIRLQVWTQVVLKRNVWWSGDSLTRVALRSPLLKISLWIIQTTMQTQTRHLRDSKKSCRVCQTRNRTWILRMKKTTRIRWSTRSRIYWLTAMKKLD